MILKNTLKITAISLRGQWANPLPDWIPMPPMLYKTSIHIYIWNIDSLEW